MLKHSFPKNKDNLLCNHNAINHIKGFKYLIPCLLLSSLLSYFPNCQECPLLQLFPHPANLNSYFGIWFLYQVLYQIQSISYPKLWVEYRLLTIKVEFNIIYFSLVLILLVLELLQLFFPPCISQSYSVLKRLSPFINCYHLSLAQVTTTAC